MVFAGTAVGFLFALIALAISVVSFPLLLDRKVGVPVAVVTSVTVLRKNPRVILGWGAIRGCISGRRIDSDLAGSDRCHALAGPLHLAPLSARHRLRDGTPLSVTFGTVS